MSLPSESSAAQNINTAKAVDTLLTDQAIQLQALADRVANLEASEKATITPQAAKAAYLTKSVGQAIGISTTAAITFDGELIDTDSMHDNAVNNSQLKAPLAGKYLITIQVETSGALAACFIRKNGTTTLVSLGTAIATLVDPFTFAANLALNDYIELVVTTAGTGRTIGGTYQTNLGMCYIGT
jgi:hypothetical protein